MEIWTNSEKSKLKNKLLSNGYDEKSESREKKWDTICNIMVEGFRFMPLGLFRLRTFRLSTWVSSVQTWYRFYRARGEDVSFTDVKIKIPDRVMWMTSRTGSVDGDSKKVRRFETGCRTRRLAFAGSPRPDEFVRYGCHTDGGGGVLMKKTA